MDLFGVELHESPIEYEIVNGECSYCGSDGDYISFEALGHKFEENDESPRGFWVCRHCETFNEELLRLGS